jgi:HPt (histidine-containing phosphotransfer) domain-containing protein
MDGYLSKPFTRQGLLDALLRFTDARTDALAVPAGQVASPTTAASVHLILDKARFQQMDALFSSSSGNNFTMLLLSFQSNSAKRIEELRRAAERKDADAIAAVAHAIKGSSGNLGFVGMERIAEMLVRSAKLGRHEEFSTLLASLEDESQKVDAFLKSHLAKPPGGA